MSLLTHAEHHVKQVKINWKSNLLGKISSDFRYTDDTAMAESEEEGKASWREEEKLKVGLNNVRKQIASCQMGKQR